MSAIGAFHFLRPAWLLLLVPIALVTWRMWRARSTVDRWRGIIEPHLLEHFVIRTERASRLRPESLFPVVAALLTVAVAGPSFRREEPPFVEDRVPLVIAIDLDRSMLAGDLQPSRLERAHQKARDILDGRRGARTALVAYAGSAHVVLPLTDDPALLGSFLDSLAPEIMPRPGKDPAAALATAAELLAPVEAAGTILFLTDGIAVDAAETFAGHLEAGRDQVAVLAMATDRGAPVPNPDGSPGEVSTLDRLGLEAVARAGARVTEVTVDASDVERLLRQVESHYEQVRRDDESLRWRDDGYWLVWPAALLMLAWYRRGWTIQWER